MLTHRAWHLPRGQFQSAELVPLATQNNITGIPSSSNAHLPLIRGCRALSSMSKNTEKSKNVSSYSTPTLDTQTVPIAAKVLTPSPLLTPQLWCKCRWHVDAIYMSPGHVNVAVFCDMKALGADDLAYCSSTFPSLLLITHHFSSLHSSQIAMWLVNIDTTAGINTKWSLYAFCLG